MLRVYVRESRRHAGRPLHAAIVEIVREGGVRGCSVFRGIGGYGADGRLQSSRAIDTVADMPLIIEAIDAEPRIRALLPALEAVLEAGLVTVARVRTPAGYQSAPSPTTT